MSADGQRTVQEWSSRVLLLLVFWFCWQRNAADGSRRGTRQQHIALNSSCRRSEKSVTRMTVTVDGNRIFCFSFPQCMCRLYTVGSTSQIPFVKKFIFCIFYHLFVFIYLVIYFYFIIIFHYSLTARMEQKHEFQNFLVFGMSPCYNAKIACFSS